MIRNLVTDGVREALRQRRAILELNQEQRRGNVGNADAFGKRHSTQTWGRHFLRIPEMDLLVLRRLNPALNSKDPKEFSAAWLEFERSDASLPYRVSEDYSGPGNSIFISLGGDHSPR